MSDSHEDPIKTLNEKRLRAWEAGKEILDRAVNEGRSMTAEERAAYDKADAEIVDCDKARAEYAAHEARKVVEGVREEFERTIRPQTLADADRADADRLRAFATRGSKVHTIDLDLTPAARAHRAWRDGLRGAELRVIAGDVGASAGSLVVPTDMASRLYEYMTASVALRRMRTTIVTTAGGNPIDFPRVGTHGIATQIADEDTALAGTDPILDKMTLSTYDSGQLVAVSNDFVDDSGVDVLDFVARNIGRAIGEHTAAWYVTGGGSTAPNGVMTAITGAGTIATGGTLVDPTFEKLIDLVYSVNDNYRSGGAEWLMRDLTAAVVRKIRDGAGGTTGAFIWQPSPTVGLQGGQPDRLLGYPVFTDPNVASLASNAKVVAFGDFSAYYIRDGGTMRLERSDDLYFNKDQVAFRGKLRTDADLIDSNAINIIKRSV